MTSARTLQPKAGGVPSVRRGQEQDYGHGGGQPCYTCGGLSYTPLNVGSGQGVSAHLVVVATIPLLYAL